MSCVLMPTSLEVYLGKGEEIGTAELRSKGKTVVEKMKEAEKETKNEI